MAKRKTKLISQKHFKHTQKTKAESDEKSLEGKSHIVFCSFVNLFKFVFSFSFFSGNYSRLACEIQFTRSMGYYLIQVNKESHQVQNHIQSVTLIWLVKVRWLFLAHVWLLLKQTSFFWGSWDSSTITRFHQVKLFQIPDTLSTMKLRKALVKFSGV